MANETAKDRRLIGYLLGQTSGPERTELEDKYFTDDALFEYMAAVETELIDAFVRGELAESDRVAFEVRFLGSSRQRARVEMARRLQARMAPITPVAPVARSAARETPRPAVPAPGAPMRRSTSPLIGAIAGGIAVVAAVVGWWSLQSSSPRAAAGADAPAGTAQPLAAARPAPQPMAAAPPLTTDKLTAAPVGHVALVLAPGSAGSREGHALLTLAPGTDAVRLQIDHQGPARERYAVIVSTKERQRAWTELNMAARAPGASGVILQIPASSLPPGDYVVTLSGGTLQARRLEALADYSLRVR